MRLPRFDKPPRGPHVQEANYVRSVYLHQRSLTGVTITQFAKDLDVSVAALNHWIGGFRRIRSDSLRKLTEYAPPNLRPPVGAIADEAVRLDSDTERSYEPSVGGKAPTRGYAAVTDQARIVARMLDRIEDEEARNDAMDAAREAIKRFRVAGASMAGPSPAKR